MSSHDDEWRREEDRREQQRQEQRREEERREARRRDLDRQDEHIHQDEEIRRARYAAERERLLDDVRRKDMSAAFARLGIEYPGGDAESGHAPPLSRRAEDSGSAGDPPVRDAVRMAALEHRTRLLDIIEAELRRMGEPGVAGPFISSLWAPPADSERQASVDRYREALGRLRDEIRQIDVDAQWTEDRLNALAGEWHGAVELAQALRDFASSCGLSYSVSTFPRNPP
jgi:hypothetical protein